MIPVTDEQVEKACRAWFNAERDGKRIATIPWDDAVAKLDPRAINEYRLRMRAALEAVL